MKKFIFTDNKKIFNRVLIGVLTFIILVALVSTTFIVDSFAIANPKCYHKFFLSTFNGSYDAENMPSTYWQVKSLEDSEGNGLKVKAKVELPITNKSERVLGQIWINVSDFAGDKLEIFSYYGTSEYALNKNEKPFVITKSDIKNSQDGWFKVYDFEDTENFAKASTYTDDYSITFSSGIRVREMVFIDSEYELIENIKVINEYIDQNLNMEDKENPIALAVDESKYFDMSKVNKK